MYSIDGNIAKINGQQGKYDTLVKNADARYGRNAADNYKTYINDIGNVDKKVPLEFEYRYMPDGKFNKFAIIGNAYEEMGQQTRIKKEKLTEQFKKANLTECSADALDLNNDGYIDTAEYSAGTLAQDILSSSDDCQINPSKADGVINAKGEAKSIALNKTSNQSAAREIYTNLYKDFELDNAQQEFLSDKDNLNG